ncbi:MAG TPA: hypothetical protein VKV95_12725 [Terriglobia bacterium]|nr:hypothetical protein [Terriglobia bacterium]
MKTASWIILVVISAATLLYSLNSLRIAYSSAHDRIGPASLTELSAGRPDVATAIRARRATAAAYAVGFNTLFLVIVLVPYRRGDIWAWWALAGSAVVVTGLILLRVPLLGISLGTPSAGMGAATANGALIQLAVVAVGLALDAGRLKRKG